jgi:hypothetical protein
VRAPLTFAWRNVVFGADVDDPWALFRIHTASYAGLPTAGKVDFLASLASYACAVEADFQLLRVTRAWSSASYAAAARSMLDRDHGHGDRLGALVASHEAVIDTGGAAEPDVFLAVSLAGLSGTTGAVARLLIDLRRVFGLRDARAITQRHLDEVLDAEAVAYARVADYLDVDRVSTMELQWLVRRSALRGLSEPWCDAMWQPQALVLDADDPDGGRRFRPLEA